MSKAIGQYQLHKAISHAVNYLDEHGFDINQRDVTDVIETWTKLASTLIKPGVRVNTIKELDKYYRNLDKKILEAIMEAEYDYLISIGLVSLKKNI